MESVNKSWYIGSFDDGSAEMIPKDWVCEKYEIAYWPPKRVSKAKLLQLKRKCDLPELDWISFNFKIYSSAGNIINFLDSKFLKIFSFFSFN